MSTRQPDINPARALATNARYFPDLVAVRYDGGDLTYSQLHDKVSRLAGALRERGVVPGDRVAFVGMNSSAFIVTMLATLRAGAVFVPINFRLVGPEVANILERSGTTALVAEEGHRELVESVKDSTPVEHFLLVDDDTSAPAADEHPGWEGWSAAIASAEPLTDTVPRSHDDAAALLFTSGTTGVPKGVILTLGNVWWNSVNVDSRIDARRGDVTYASAPLFHIGALNSFVLRILARGGTVLVRRTFDPVQFLDDIVEHKVNTMFVVPAMIQAVTRVPDAFERDLSSLHGVVVAGAPVPPSQIREFAEHGILLEQAWGLTETAPFSTHLPSEHTLEKVGSCGIAMPYTEVAVVDPGTGEVCPPDVAGELVVRGPNVTPGYWENPEATAEAFDADGWFHTGDIGYVDEDGFFYIVDRLKDMIITGGENVYPAEVERVLASMPGVVDVAVVGAPDPDWGQTVVAVITASEGTMMTLEQVREYAGTSLARYKLPRKLEFIQVMPRNASGKLDKKTIRELLP